MINYGAGGENTQRWHGNRNNTAGDRTSQLFEHSAKHDQITAQTQTVKTSGFPVGFAAEFETSRQLPPKPPTLPLDT
jgi:hypothetical protein